jgi:UDP-2,3-diacylglucosamine hydrolase
MSTLLIADLHLQSGEEDRTTAFLDFLRHRTATAEALYIVGDLFDVWVGDDDQQLLHCVVAQALRQLQVPCYFIAGNRDFLLGQRFADASHLILLAAPQLITLYQVPTLILHGDSLCTGDRAYQRLRYWLHQPWVQRRFLSLPLPWRRSIARQLRQKSRLANQQKTQQIMDVNPEAVVALLEQTGAARLIHGHTHRAGRHTLVLEQDNHYPERLAERIVLGAWEQSASVLQIDASGAQLLAFPF